MARVHVSISEGVIEIDGNEEFVAAQISRLEPLLLSALTGGLSSGKTREDSDQERASPKGEGESRPSSFDHVFAESDGKFRILKKVPGDSDAEKTVNIALLLAYAALSGGKDSIAADDVREACRSHGCFNSSNFAAYLKAEKQYLLIEGKPRSPSKTVRLTVPGKGRAEELFRQMASS